MSKHLGCSCGQYDASEAAFHQLSRQQKEDFLRKAYACETCKHDRKSFGESQPDQQEGRKS
ncbi:hypothetical protein FS764_16590 [Agrobacterium vitis]|uniref:hypothetical protein n=1 Tax=Agrobacterium vitis TaxID=373 RepID=UPI001F369C4A|nr:hypothetical protein [Agrobacterium vitis]MCF1468526.1 hypothetical protein [Agrobacterium vitis]